jgi:flagellar basal-body rod protein FlgB
MGISSLANTSLYEKALDASAMRDEAINQNIANVDTPNYKRKQVMFEEFLKSAQGDSQIVGNRTDSRHIPIGESDLDGVSPVMSEDSSSNSMRIDGNNVDVNLEMSALSKNSIKYAFIVNKLNGEFKKIKSVISEGRR